MLQASRDNDASVQELMEHVGALVAILEVAAEQMDTPAARDIHGDIAACLMEFQKLYE